MERRYLIPAKAQEQDQFGGEAPVILTENPVHLGNRPNRRVADQLRPVSDGSPAKKSSKCRGGRLEAIGRRLKGFDRPALACRGVGIALDVRELPAKLKACACLTNTRHCPESLNMG